MSRLTSIFPTIRRSPYQSALAVLMTSITFFIISIFALVVLGATAMLKYFESRPQVTAFFKDEANEMDVSSLKSTIEQKYSIESSKYISKADALNIYKEQNKSNPLLLEMVTSDILPASLELSAYNVSDLEGIANLMQQNPKVEEVVFQKDVIDILKKWLGGIRLAGITLTSLLVLASLSTIMVIISLKFRSKKPEIYTLSLLGATNWYIRSPYIFEAVLYGSLGSVVGWGLSYLTLLYVTPNLLDFFGEIPLLPVPYWVMLALLGSELILGIILGAISSAIATRRYLR